MEYDLKITMNPELKTKWINALRSGKYAQCEGELKQIDSEGETVGYCCLGVLLDISEIGKWEYKEDFNEAYAPYYEATYEIDHETHPKMKYDTLLQTISDELLYVLGIDKDSAGVLMGLNDGGGEFGMGQTFDDIADAIESGVAVTLEYCGNCDGPCEHRYEDCDAD